MIETYLLEQFAAFAKYGTLLKASEELHITQPTLSRSMKKLEEELGVPIFVRENSKLSLNETGKIAAEYAEKALTANQDMIDHVLAYDRSLRTVSIGSCSPFPISELIQPLQNYLPGKTLLTELSASDETLVKELKNHQYNLVILHSFPEDKSLYAQRYMEERIYLSVRKDHPLAARKSVSFRDLRRIRILVSAQIGFWMDICRKHLEHSNLLVQTNMDAMDELISASSVPFFNSDRMMERGYRSDDRVAIPISDEDAHTVYWVVCRASDKLQYRSVFNAVRSFAIHDSGTAGK